MSWKLEFIIIFGLVLSQLINNFREMNYFADSTTDFLWVNKIVFTSLNVYT